ncbi:hypothetical protein Taro_019701 [Colocasia esculenta]|uniref:U-box domain-containing protein n=1 Tax=Colocasia esculenta TaxID=4460 RepID=A0A843UUJ4_COLES|nr:hypothetical protein [Colocasia esculenta]
MAGRKEAPGLLLLSSSLSRQRQGRRGAAAVPAAPSSGDGGQRRGGQSKGWRRPAQAEAAVSVAPSSGDREQSMDRRRPAQVEAAARGGAGHGGLLPPHFFFCQQDRKQGPELECTDVDATSELIEVALRDQRDYVISCPEHMLKIAESLGLTSNQELLMERISLEKEKVKAEFMKRKEDADILGMDSRYLGPINQDSASRSSAVGTGLGQHQTEVSAQSSEEETSLVNRYNLETYSHVEKLVDDLRSEKNDVKSTQENAVTALLNLSLNDNNKTAIAEAGATEPIVHVLKCGTTVAKENAAAALGKKDSASALFNLSILHENKARIVQAGAVKHLVNLMDPDSGMVDKAVALLANLSTVTEGRMAITQEGGIPLLVEVVETGSEKGKENAASTLLQLCISSQKFCDLVLQEGAVPPLIALSRLGTPRAKAKVLAFITTRPVRWNLDWATTLPGSQHNPRGLLEGETSQQRQGARWAEEAGW